MTPKALLAPLLFAWLSCAAQGFPPDQVDLQSSYCLGVLNARAAVQTELTKNPIPDEYRSAVAAMIARNNENLGRLRSYLAIRFQTIDPTGMLIASAQGNKDMTSQAAQINQCAQTCADNACVLNCKGLPVIEAKLARCDGMSFLPY